MVSAAEAVAGFSAGDAAAAALAVSLAAGAAERSGAGVWSRPDGPQAATRAASPSNSAATTAACFSRLFMVERQLPLVAGSTATASVSHRSSGRHKGASTIAHGNAPKPRARKMRRSAAASFGSLRYVIAD